MEQPTKQHEASMLRESARQIRQHVEHYVCSEREAKRWLAVAESKERRAASLEAEVAA